MKKYKLLFTLLMACSLAFTVSCKKESGTEPAPKPKDTVAVKPVVLEDTIARTWKVKTATHNGSSDASSTGLILEIHKNGTYILVSTGYNGIWEFLENKTKVLLDKDNMDFKTTWTIQKLTSKNLNVSFKSPFTGGNAVWNMVPF